MFYRKNLFAWEQMLRVIAGLGMIATGLIYLPGWPGWLVAASGAFLGVTGVFGWCPACAMVGRKPIDRT